jgi:hypothetical protein
MLAKMEETEIRKEEEEGSSLKMCRSRSRCMRKSHVLAVSQPQVDRKKLY